MENYSVYEDMASRTSGDIYIGVVGPVRTGKSTFIKRFMETLVVPHADASERQRMTDELPQLAAGKTVMTTEPKFVPAKAAKVKIREGVNVSVRLVDCVGFGVEGVNGFEEDGAPRLVKTPWSDEPLEFEKAAALGTEKVIKDHSTIGVLVTTDGSISSLPRSAYEEAEERTVNQLKEMGKPFVVLLNAVNPKKCAPLKEALEEKYGVSVLAINAEQLDEAGFSEIMQKVLFEFPLTEVSATLPAWIQSLPEDSAIVSGIMEKLKAVAGGLHKMKDCLVLENLFGEEDGFVNPDSVAMDLGKGRAEIGITAKDGLFYEVVSQECGERIANDFELMRYVKGLAGVKKHYERIKEAFAEAEESGYGTVAPAFEEMQLETPKLIKKGSGYGVHFKASAPSYHILKVDVSGEVNPIVGTQKQGEEFVKETIEAYENGSDKVWETNIFGKSLKELLSDGLTKKTDGMSAEIRKKMRRTITRIVNEGKGGVICILL